MSDNCSGDSEDAYAGLLRRKEADGMIFLGHTLPVSLNDLVAKKGAARPSSTAANSAIP